MKHGRTLQELAVEIRRQAAEKRDYLAETNVINMVPDISGTRFVVDGVDGDFSIAETAHKQIGQYTDIPWKYYDRMRSNPELLAHNVNYWLHGIGAQPERRMIRTLDGSLRAFLSDRYRRIDNMQIAEAVLPIIGQMQEARVDSCEITDNKMYLKVVNPRLTAEVSKGDVVQAGIVVSNSEVGLGSVSVSPLIFRLVCTNGMIAQDSSVRKYHIGRANESDIDLGIFRDETLEADDKALMMKLQDAVAAAVNQAVFAKIVDQLKDAKQAKIEARTVPKVVELTSKQVGITQYEQEGVLGHLIEGGDLSLYGLGNAVTRYAQDVKSYDRSTDLEAIGYKIITLAPTAWNTILSTANKEV
ncbi:MAG: DUF945 domain-containing protein [Oscillospiraceae bacterium]|nr:DUF945 domain-containing protein [Oscillospiraceae bacterium]